MRPAPWPLTSPSSLRNSSPASPCHLGCGRYLQVGVRVGGLFPNEFPVLPTGWHLSLQRSLSRERNQHPEFPGWQDGGRRREGRRSDLDELKAPSQLSESQSPPAVPQFRTAQDGPNSPVSQSRELRAWEMRSHCQARERQGVHQRSRPGTFKPKSWEWPPQTRSWAPRNRLSPGIRLRPGVSTTPEASQDAL